MNSTRQLKQLETQLNLLNQEASALAKNVDSKMAELNKKLAEIGNVKSKIKKLQGLKNTIVSEHAMLRYCERVMKIDMDAVKNNILTDKVKNLIEELGGNGKYPNESGFQVVIKDNTITTITI